MRALFLVAPALMLVACNRQAEPATDAPAETPLPAEFDGSIGDRTGPPLDPDIAKGEIPARFRGVWDAEGTSCDPRSDLRVKIGARSIEFYESVGDVSGVGSDGNDAIADLVLTGEGETDFRSERLSLKSTPDGERLRISDALKPESPDAPLRKRCPA